MKGNEGNRDVLQLFGPRVLAAASFEPRTGTLTSDQMVAVGVVNAGAGDKVPKAVQARRFSPQNGQFRGEHLRFRT